MFHAATWYFRFLIHAVIISQRPLLNPSGSFFPINTPADRGNQPRPISKRAATKDVALNFPVKRSWRNKLTRAARTQRRIASAYFSFKRRWKLTEPVITGGRLGGTGGGKVSVNFYSTSSTSREQRIPRHRRAPLIHPVERIYISNATLMACRYSFDSLRTGEQLSLPLSWSDDTCNTIFIPRVSSLFRSFLFLSPSVSFFPATFC